VVAQINDMMAQVDDVVAHTDSAMSQKEDVVAHIDYMAQLETMGELN
jgi:hypothetical protein